MPLDLDIGRNADLAAGSWRSALSWKHAWSVPVGTEPWAQEDCWGVGVRREVTWAQREGPLLTEYLHSRAMGPPTWGLAGPTGSVTLLCQMAIIQASLCCALLTRPQLPETKDRPFLDSSQTWPNQHVPSREIPSPVQPPNQGSP